MHVKDLSITVATGLFTALDEGKTSRFTSLPLISILDVCKNGGSKQLSAQVTYRSVLLISVVLHLFVRSYVVVSKAIFAENVNFVLSSPD